MPSTALFGFAQEMEKQLSRRVRQEGLFGESGWCLVRYYRELIDGVYNDAEGDGYPKLTEAEARAKLVEVFERFEGDLTRLLQRGSTTIESTRHPYDDDESSVLDDVSSVYYDDIEESSPEPEDLPRTPTQRPLSFDQESIPSMIISDDGSFPSIPTPIDRPGNPTPNATGESKFSNIPFTPLPKHGFPGTFNPEPYAELFLSKGVPYEAHFVNLNGVPSPVFLGPEAGKRNPRDRKSLPALPRFPGTPTTTNTNTGSEGEKKIKKKRSFWKRSSNDAEKKEKSKEKEELKAPTFWGPM